MKGNIMTESQVMVARSRVDWFNVGANMGASEEIVGSGGLRLNVDHIIY
jgi:hypothetical protein